MMRCLIESLVLLAMPALALAQPAPTPKLTPQQQEKLKERDRLFGEANKLIKDGKLVDAMATAEKALAIEREIFTDAQNVSWLGWLASSHEQREDFAAAWKARQEVLGITTKLLGEQHWQATNARLQLTHVVLLEKMDRQQRQSLSEATNWHRQGFELTGKGISRRRWR